MTAKDGLAMSNRERTRFGHDYTIVNTATTRLCSGILSGHCLLWQAAHHLDLVTLYTFGITT